MHKTEMTFLLTCSINAGDNSVHSSDRSPKPPPEIFPHATSLEWVYTKIREDYDIQTKGIHFLNIVDLEYDKKQKHWLGSTMNTEQSSSIT